MDAKPIYGTLCRWYHESALLWKVGPKTRKVLLYGHLPRPTRHCRSKHLLRETGSLLHLTTIMVMSTAPWRFDMQESEPRSTVSPVAEGSQSLVYTTTESNGNVLAGEAWVTTQTSLLTTFTAAPVESTKEYSKTPGIGLNAQSVPPFEKLQMSPLLSRAGFVIRINDTCSTLGHRPTLLESRPWTGIPVSSSSMGKSHVHLV